MGDPLTPASCKRRRRALDIAAADFASICEVDPARLAAFESGDAGAFDAGEAEDVEGTLDREEEWIADYRAERRRKKRRRARPPIDWVPRGALPDPNREPD